MISTGLDALADRDFADLRGRRVVVLSNPTGVLVREGRVVHGVDAMVAAGVRVVGVLGPEHGFRGTATAGESEADTVDPRTGVPLLDGYDVPVEGLADLLRAVAADVVVVDLADVGVRFYTYLWTMRRLLLAAALVPGVRVVVLDRPNPLGRARRGGMLRPGFESAIGEAGVLLQHGLTMGELALLFNPAESGVELDVVEVSGWDGRPWSPGHGIWVPPSPNLPTPQAAFCYPGTGLLEAVTLSEGRGTTRPFTLVGAPWVDERLVGHLPTPAGAVLREAAFEPLVVPHFDTHAGQLCRGIEVHVTDPETFDAVRFGLDLLTTARDLYPASFTHRGDDWRWLGLMSGSNGLRDGLLAGATTHDLLAGWEADRREWDDLVGWPAPPDLR
ncbi:exo-beta-N-acetylmuramidase NamZ family protein [Aestuariimicrobium soli]|uniref:exo-beta-N-acetylmuramidase NamZ family protein n=1 Tax=Aestuariimicrobium soli TaxID=2035834 RepID=UPI003EB6A18B